MSEKPKVSNEDLANQFTATPQPGATLPAIYTNRFFLTVASDRVRISFGEAVGGMETHHLAVNMSHVDALELASLISKLMDEHKAKQSTATKSMN